MLNLFTCIVAFSLVVNTVKAQVPDSLTHPGVYSKDSASIRIIINSLKSRMLQDTSRFSKSDLIKPSTFTENKFSYSPLFVINRKYRYKLDIIEGGLVVDFVRTFLRPENIKMVWILHGDLGLGIAGSRGKNGIVFIETKRKRGLNYRVAGIDKRSKRKDNFDQQF